MLFVIYKCVNVNCKGFIKREKANDWKLSYENDRMVPPSELLQIYNEVKYLGGTVQLRITDNPELRIK